ncbi:MAG: CDP-glucose 4,6-dehydratase [Bdellovibrionota bacterium]
MSFTASKLDKQFWQGRTVLITGHTGFMGSWLVFWLNYLGAEVIGVSLDPATKPSLFNELNLHKKCKDIRADIRDMAKITEIFQQNQPEILIHLAAQPLVLPSYLDPIETHSTNVMGTAHVLEGARQCPSIRSVSVITSDKCYENKGLRKAFTEDDPMGGDDPYSASKGAAEIVTSSYRSSFFNKSSIPLLSFRAGNIVGGGDWSLARLVPDLVRSLMSSEKISLRNPQATRPWQYVLEPLYVYLLMIQRSFVDSKGTSCSWNIGPDEQSEKSVIDVAKGIGMHWGRHNFYDVSDRPAEVHEAPYLRINSQKLRTTIGWKPVLNFDEMLQWSVEWYKGFYEKNSVDKLCLSQIQRFVSIAEGKKESI